MLRSCSPWLSYPPLSSVGGGNRNRTRVLSLKRRLQDQRLLYPLEDVVGLRFALHGDPSILSVSARCLWACLALERVLDSNQRTSDLLLRRPGSNREFAVNSRTRYQLRHIGMVEPKGIEPFTRGLQNAVACLGTCDPIAIQFSGQPPGNRTPIVSLRASKSTVDLEAVVCCAARGERIELSFSASKAAVFPLDDPRMLLTPPAILRVRCSLALPPRQ